MLSTLRRDPQRVNVSRNTKDARVGQTCRQAKCYVSGSRIRILQTSFCIYHSVTSNMTSQLRCKEKADGLTFTGEGIDKSGGDIAFVTFIQ